jgi:hypothetical protein
MFVYSNDCQYGWWNTDVKLRHEILAGIANDLENPKIKDKITHCFGKKETYEQICRDWLIDTTKNAGYRNLQKKIMALDNNCCSLHFENGRIEMRKGLDVFTFDKYNNRWILINVHLFADKC